DARPSRPAFTERIRRALDVGALGPAIPRGRRRFFTHRRPGMEQSALAVSEDGGPARTLVDPAPVSAAGTTALDWWEPSPDGELVRVGLPAAGTEAPALRL